MKCEKCGKDLDSFYMHGKRAGTISIYGGPDKSYCSIECYNERIDKSEWKTKNPRLFEYDSKNEIVDIFVRQDPKCPFPFHDEDWWHQGFYLKGFIMFLNDFFERYNLPYTVMENKEIEDLRMLSQPRPLTEADKKRILRQYEDDDEE